MKSMENAERTRNWVRDSDTQQRRNYIREVWNAMTKAAKAGVSKAEENKQRTQFWATIGVTALIPVVIAFCSWFSVHLINYGEQKARQEMFDKELKLKDGVISEQGKEIERLKQLPMIPAKEEVKPKPPPRRTQPTRGGRRQNLNGQIPDPYAGGLAKFGNLYLEK